MNKLILAAIVIAVGVEARADAPITPVINAITESQLWQDYSGPTFDYLQGLLPGADYLSGGSGSDRAAAGERPLRGRPRLS